MDRPSTARLGSHTTLRAIVVLLTLWVLTDSLSNLAPYARGYASFGFDTDDAGVVRWVEPRAAGAKAGIRIGDVVQASRMPLQDRLNAFIRVPAPGSAIVFPVQRAGRLIAIPVRAEPAPRPTTWWKQVPKMATAVIAIGVAAWLAFRGPSLLTFAFFLFVAALSLQGPLTKYLPWRFSLVELSARGVLIAAGFWGLAAFIARIAPVRFPRLLQAVALLAGVAVGGAVVLAYARSAVLGYDQTIVSHVGHWVTTAFAIVIAAALVGAYGRAEPVQRQRIHWVVLGFAVALAGQLLLALTPHVMRFFGSEEEPLWVDDAFGGLIAAIPLAVAYPIVRGRPIDVRLVVRRTFVLAALLYALVAAFALIAWAFAKQLEAPVLAIVLEAAVALAAGMSMRTLLRRVEGLVDRAVLPERDVARAQMLRLRGELRSATERATIDALLVEETLAALELSAAAVFLSESGRYVCVRTLGDITREGAVRPLDDRLALDLRTRFAPVEIAGDVLTVPLRGGDGLFGFCLFGPHANGAALDGEERALLARVGRAASRAYEHVAAQTSRAAADAALAEIAALRSENALLRRVTGRPAPAEVEGRIVGS